MNAHAPHLFTSTPRSRILKTTVLLAMMAMLLLFIGCANPKVQNSAANSAAQQRVVLIGWHPDAVDYAKYPQLNPANLHAALENDRKKIEQLEHHAELHFLKDAHSAAPSVADYLRANAVNVVLVGAGVRLDPDSFLVFERVINAVHRHAPQARICFNTNPNDTAQAVERCIIAQS
jgi:hypothetical protein